MAKNDPTWNYAKWGGQGNLWTPHVYMPAQNPGDPSGMSASAARCAAMVLATGHGREIPGDRQPLLRPDV